jgi:DNA repair exonuclease SbcCD ATPase subunit
MKILSLSEENVKRLSAVEMALEEKGNLVIIAGNNEQGKSSLLDGIEMALHGGASIPAKPVRRGQDKATVEMTLGEIGLPELTVKRTMTSTGGGALTVTNADGAKLTSPQAILDALVGKLSFDPLAFVKMKAQDRTETLQKLMQLDFKAHDLEKSKLYDKRTEVNRTLKSKQAMLAANPKFLDIPAEEQSSEALFEEQKQASLKNAANAQLRSKAESAADAVKRSQDIITSMSESIAELKAKVESMTASLAKEGTELSARKATLAQFDDQLAKAQDVDLSQFRVKLAQVEQTNDKVRKNKAREQIRVDMVAAEKESDKLTKQIETIEREKRDTIAAAKFPLPGMTLGDSGEVLLDGLPFEQASTKGQLMASLAMGAALNPKLRVLLVRSGNDLDDSAMKVLAEWADAQNMQVWLERISTNGKVAVIIEDGRAVEEPAPEENEILGLDQVP